MLIYWNKVAIIYLKQEKNYQFIVENVSFARAQKAVFHIARIGVNMFVAQ